MIMAYACKDVEPSVISISHVAVFIELDHKPFSLADALDLTSFVKSHKAKISCWSTTRLESLPLRKPQNLNLPLDGSPFVH